MPAGIGAEFFRVRGDDRHAVAGKLLRDALVVLHPRAAEADLHGARRDHLDDLGAVLHLDVEGNVGIFLVEILQKVRQIILARHRGGRERDGAAHLLRKALERRGGVLAHLQDLLGVAVEELARVGGVGLLRRTHDELDAELTLERGDVGGNGRLRQVQQLGRAGKAAVFDHIDERLQLLDVHINVHFLGLPSRLCQQNHSLQYIRFPPVCPVLFPANLPLRARADVVY